jgi:hypothetical protein
MTRHLRTERALCLILFAAGLALAGCAGTPKPAQTPAAGGSDYGRMAPIPNPTTEASAPTPRVAKPAPAKPAARAATPKAQPARTPAKVAANPARATQLRAAGLEQLNRGEIGQAVALLQQARQLDPGNMLIVRDLDRAVRINRTVSGRP